MGTAECVAGHPGNSVRTRWAAHSVGAWDTYTQTCPSADSLAAGRLLNPKVLRFPHPKKCCHLSPGALFSFQGFCGAGRLGSKAERGGGPVLPCRTQSRSRLAFLGQTQLLLSACAPGRSHQPGCGISRGVCTNLCDGCSPCCAVQLPEDCEPAGWERGFQLQRLPPGRKGREDSTLWEWLGFLLSAKNWVQN